MKSLILAVIFALGIAVAASAAPSLDVGSAEGLPGQNVSIQVTLANTAASGISGLSADIRYDAAVLEPTSVSMGTVLKDTGKNLLKGTPVPGIIRIGVIGLAKATALPDGAIANISFAIKPEAAAGLYPLAVTPDATDMTGKSVAISSSGGSIRIGLAEQK